MVRRTKAFGDLILVDDLDILEVTRVQQPFAHMLLKKQFSVNAILNSESMTIEIFGDQADRALGLAVVWVRLAQKQVGLKRH